jgi:thioredoxin-like negative regulator of GroEL
MNFHQLRRSVCTLFAGAALAGLSPLAWALDIQPYSAERLAQLQTGGKPVAVHFHAEWCGTCKTQEKALQTIKAEGSLAQVTLLVADYDKEKDLRKQMKVRAQSTLVVFKGSQEVARLGGDTATDKLKSALAKAS